MNSTKSLGFCFKKGEEKTKQKDFAMCVTESKRQFAPVLFIAQPLANINSKEYQPNFRKKPNEVVI